MNKLLWDCVYWCHTRAWFSLDRAGREHYARLYYRACQINKPEAGRLANLAMSEDGYSEDGYGIPGE